MTFDTLEKSKESGQPVELYEFTLGGVTRRYTSAQDKVTIGVIEYEPEIIKRENINKSNTGVDDSITVSLPTTNPFAKLFTVAPPGQTATAIIKRIHRGDIGGSGDLILTFTGIVRAVEFDSELNVARMSIQSMLSGMGRSIPRFTFQGLCNHVLFDPRCKVYIEDFKFTGTVSSVVGALVTIPGLSAKPDGYYTAGYIKASDGDARLILGHVGDTITIISAFSIDITGESVSVYAGCDHSPGVCISKFSNIANFGGFPFVPMRNPFSTEIN